MFSSLYRFYSIGVVAENKAMSTHVIQVVPTEVLPMTDGELKSNPTPLEASGVNASGEDYTLSLELDNAIEATWLRWNTNRQTSPDVRRGERVLIWQYADTDKFYWTSLGMDNHYRKLETVRYAISATRDETDNELRADNTYSVELSSHNKAITFKTSNADGEPHTYTLQVNTKDGVVVITDDIGNYLQLESQENRITFNNADDTKVTLDKKELHAYAKDYCKIHIDGPAHLVAPEIHLGETNALQHSVLGDNLQVAMEKLFKAINDSKVIGNLGIPTSPIKSVVPVVDPEIEAISGNVYSKVNKNQ